MSAWVSSGFSSFLPSPKNMPVGGPRACPRNTGHEAGIHPGWDTSPSQGTMHTHSHLGAITVANPPTGMFLGSGRKSETPEEPMHMHGNSTQTQTQDRTWDPGAKRMSVAPPLRYVSSTGCLGSEKRHTDLKSREVAGFPDDVRR
ncbi:hypothetical protein PGIGA_G00189270 [Pangasianodon gigas]|uniref:Uncharacterized protein n=1 Tax=Pangasianodon gigas TaxID=30993 RepID=A0ACC5WCS2_PANGG|nr:hypothetical protein [Pangasianodon gigas]